MKLESLELNSFVIGMQMLCDSVTNPDWEIVAICLGNNPISERPESYTQMVDAQWKAMWALEKYLKCASDLSYCVNSGIAPNWEQLNVAPHIEAAATAIAALVRAPRTRIR